MGRIRLALLYPISDLSGLRICGRGGITAPLNSGATHDDPQHIAFYEALKEDVDVNGVLNPIIVHAREDGNHVRIGGTRVRACKALGITYIPAYVLDTVERYPEYREAKRPEGSYEQYDGDFCWHKEQNWTEIKKSVGL